MAKKKNPLRNILTQLIADIFEGTGNKSLNYKQIAARLKITDPEEKQAILAILQEESHRGLFKQVDKGKFVLKELKTILT